MNDFTSLIEKHYKKNLEDDPIWGSDLGLEEYDSLLPRGDRAHMEEYIAYTRSFLNEVKSLSPDGLSFDEKIDREAIIYATEHDLFRMTEMEIWRSFPKGPDIIGSALYTLITRSSPSFEERLKSIIARMKKAPAYIRETRELLDRPVWIWVEIGIESCHRMKGFIDYVEEMAVKMVSDHKLLEELHHEAVKVNEAFKDHEHWLYTEVLPKSIQQYAIGEEKFDRLLEKRRLGLSRKEILDLGENYVKTIKGDIAHLARTIDSTATVDQIMQKIRDNHPADFAGVLKECRSLMQQARDFVRDSGFATLPAEEVLEIEETPIFMRHFIPFAAYSSPGKYDKQQKGIYMITPIEGNSDRLRDLCFADMVNTSVHEGYPGHHLQMSSANLNPSKARIFSHAFEFIEGWAHYCEDAAAEEGFINTPETAMIRQKDMLWRAWRIIIDIKLSSGTMTFDEAIGHLVKDAGLEEVGALAEVKRYTYTPSYQLSYLIGKHLLKNLKTKIQQANPAIFTLKRFHDTLLQAGNLPIYLMEKILAEKMKQALTH